MSKGGSEQDYEYVYKKTEGDGFGVDYLKAENVEDAQKKLLEISKGGDVEIVNVKRVK